MSDIRFTIAVMVFLMVNAIVFGAGLVAVLLVPALSDHALASIATVVVASVILSAPVSWMIAPRLRLRYWRQRNMIGQC